MDPDPPPCSQRKMRFVPKKPKPVAAKIEPEIEDADPDAAAQAEQEALARKFHERFTRHRRKVEQKPSQIAFGPGAAAHELKTFGNQRAGNSSRSNVSDSEDMDVDEMKDFSDFTGLTNSPSHKKKTEYKEPWDYHNSCYPTILPWRRPFSGDPECLDKEEFENAVEYDENSINSASDLDLWEEDAARRMLFLLFPDNVPLGRPPFNAITPADKMKEVVTKGKEIVGTSTAAKGKQIVGTSTVATRKEMAEISVKPPVKGCPPKGVGNFKELPEGYMGKMLVYKSGAVKLKLGDILYDVSPGSSSTCTQTVGAINTTESHYAELGEVNKRAVVSPDIDSLVDNFIDLG